MLAVDDKLRGVPVGVVGPPAGTASPSVLVAIVGPLPEPVDGSGKLTIDTTLEMCRGHEATAVFIPEMFTPEEKVQFDTVDGIRLRGHTAMRNWGCERALEYGYDYLLLLENDARVFPDTLSRLLAHDRDVIIPRLNYPQLPIIATMCFGPRPLPTDTGLMVLRWAAHTAVLFSRRVLETTGGKVFQGFATEGEDHLFWKKHGFQPVMDLDTPVDVLRVARGHVKILDVPFRVHYVNGKACPGQVYEKYRFRELGVYGCTECDSEVIFQAPVPHSEIRPQEQNPVVRAYLERDRAQWAHRAKDYGSLLWPRDKGYLDAIVKACGPGPTDRVLDAGTGVGHIARAVAGSCLQVYGLDLTPEMLALAEAQTRDYNIVWELGDIRAIPFPAGYFDRVYARMVIHGLTDDRDADKAVRECYRVLEDGGHFIFSEGVPPNRTAQKWYTEMFKLKEERRTMTIATMRRMMEDAGFKNIRTTTYIMRQFSIANWLAYSGLPSEKQEKIMAVHRAMPEAVRKAYQAVFTEEEVVIQSKFAILVGEK